MSRKETSQDRQDSVPTFRRTVLPIKRSFLGLSHIDLYIYPTDGGPPKHQIIMGSEKELDAHIDQLNREFEKDLKKAMTLETSIFFLALNLFKKKQPDIRKAATHANIVSAIITGQVYGSPESQGSQNLLQEIEQIAEEGEGAITLMGWRSRLALKKDPEGNQFLGIDPASNKEIKKHFEKLAYMVGFNNGEIPIDDTYPLVEDLSNWDEFFNQLVFDHERQGF